MTPAELLCALLRVFPGSRVVACTRATKDECERLVRGAQ